MSLENSSSDDFELKTLALATGGRSFFPTSLTELDGVYDEISSGLANQYCLGCQSSNAGRDGVFRRIAVKIDAPGVIWRTRAG